MSGISIFQTRCRRKGGFYMMARRALLILYPRGRLIGSLPPRNTKYELTRPSYPRLILFTARETDLGWDPLASYVIHLSPKPTRFKTSQRCVSIICQTLTLASSLTPEMEVCWKITITNHGLSDHACHANGPGVFQNDTSLLVQGTSFDIDYSRNQCCRNYSLGMTFQHSLHRGRSYRWYSTLLYCSYPRKYKIVGLYLIFL